MHSRETICLLSMAVKVASSVGIIYKSLISSICGVDSPPPLFFSAISPERRKKFFRLHGADDGVGG